MPIRPLLAPTILRGSLTGGWKGSIIEERKFRRWVARKMHPLLVLAGGGSSPLWKRWKNKFMEFSSTRGPDRPVPSVSTRPISDNLNSEPLLNSSAPPERRDMGDYRGEYRAKTRRNLGVVVSTKQRAPP